MMYYTKKAFTPIAKEHSQLVEELDKQLPDIYSIVKTEQLTDLDIVDDLKHRAQLAESRYAKALEYIFSVQERYNIRENIDQILP